MRGDSSAPPIAVMVCTVMVWTLIVLMIVPEGFDYRMLVAGQTPESGGLLSRSLWLGLLTSGAILVIWRAALAQLLLRHLNTFLIAFVLLALASIAWSVEPMLTLRRDIRLLTIVLVCLAFAMLGWHERRLQSVVRPLLTLMLVASIVFGVVAPSLAIHQETSPELLGAWRGVTNHKNSLGALAGVTFLFWLHGWLAREVPAWRAVLGGALAVACMYLSRSATGSIATVFAAAFLVLLTQWPRALQPYFKYAIALVITTIAFYALAVLRLIPGQDVLLAPLTTLTGLDSTFTGRTAIWGIVNEHIALHPLLGTGYGAYWTGPNPQSPSYEFIARMGGFYPGSAHNGYLEVTNDLGWVGLLCLLGYMTAHLRQALRAMAINKAQAALYLTLFMHQVIANLSESHWLSVLSIHFVLMTLVTAALARLLLNHRLQMNFALLQQRASAMYAPNWRLSRTSG
jgi:O-antigen ligase